jgi:hypothetical protein
MFPINGKQFSAMDRRLSGTRAEQTSTHESETPLLRQQEVWSLPPAAHRRIVWNSDAHEKARERMSLIEASYEHNGMHVGLNPA